MTVASGAALCDSLLFSEETRALAEPAAMGNKPTLLGLPPGQSGPSLSPRLPTQSACKRALLAALAVLVLSSEFSGTALLACQHTSTPSRLDDQGIL